MKITILTLFPEMFAGPFSESILKRAQNRKLLQVQLVNIRDFGIGRHKVVDDTPYGGGVGMVMKVDVLDRAIVAVREPKFKKKEKIILLDARGKQFVQKIAQEFSHFSHLILVCGHYEGVDERVRSLVDETISLGDYIVTGGEIPAMMITDAVGRLVKGVLKDDATKHESFSLIGGKKEVSALLEYPQYTTPQEYNGMKVPDILLSGNHKAIGKWRREQSLDITKIHRNDLLK